MSRVESINLLIKIGLLIAVGYGIILLVLKLTDIFTAPTWLYIILFAEYVSLLLVLTFVRYRLARGYR